MRWPKRLASEVKVRPRGRRGRRGLGKAPRTGRRSRNVLETPPPPAPEWEAHKSPRGAPCRLSVTARRAAASLGPGTSHGVRSATRSAEEQRLFSRRTKPGSDRNQRRPRGHAETRFPSLPLRVPQRPDCALKKEASGHPRKNPTTYDSSREVDTCSDLLSQASQGLGSKSCREPVEDVESSREPGSEGLGVRQHPQVTAEGAQSVSGVKSHHVSVSEAPVHRA
ncbi:uncharacterized protein LOC104865149 [Fukomys damarensis]|uniref:uncharacterized protein LOC104865149 n=1 Tax=Fukomys damarensis TaxID=885580 RepID=UPI00053FBD75|nr:uncharacterized protein LOC104865149 [Fukomys damarensis]